MTRKLLAALTGIILSSTFLSSTLASTMPQSPRPFTGKGLAPAYLRCEYLVDPLGIDEASPRLSWTVESGERGQRQTAYRLLVASSEKLLHQDRGDLWDAGKVAGDETICVAYWGTPLHSHQRCFWKVKVYKAVLKDALEQAKWIWHASDEPAKVPKCQRLFICTFTIPEDAKVKQAELFAAADDAMKFAINTRLRLTTEPGNDSWRQVRKAGITADLKPGPNELRVLVENAEPGYAGLIAQLVITLEDGRIIQHSTGGSWKSTARPAKDWIKDPVDVASLAGARVLGDYGVQPWGKLQPTDIFIAPAAYLRKEFSLEKPVARATLYATALGLVDMHLNGHSVSDDFFTPGWTDYKKRVYYRTYDVTRLVRQGANALGAMLADGWFSGYIGYGNNRTFYGKYPRARAQLHLEYADGSTADIASGQGWKAAIGPILEADFLKGQTYDARLEYSGWDEPGCDETCWNAVDVGSSEVHPLVQAHPGLPVRAIEEFKAKTIKEPKPGVFVLDLGQNFAGVPRLKVSGQPGQKITLRFAERLNPDGTIYTTNLRSARSTDTYICKGKGTETWEPRFTFHGFQYVEITGLTGKPSEDTVVGVALSSDTPVAGTFTCSDPMLNQLHNNIYWTQRANFIDIPTDCPQRDERLGWTGDAQVYIRTATLNTDVEAFFTKWLVDLEDGQRADGQFPCVAPCEVAGNDGGPAWADAGVICPWTTFEVYGDRRVLERHYDAMKRFIEFCRKRSTPELLPPANFHCFGDWLSIRADTPKEVIYTAYFAHCTKLTARAAEVLGKADDASKYNALFERICAAFNRAYVSADGRIKGNTQCCYVLALAFDLLQGEVAKLAAQHLVADIEKRDWHLSTGFVGTKSLMLVLSKIGRSDVAFRLLHNDTFPSWGFSIKHGATSIWERWDGWTPEKGFQDPGMNSFAHYSFGAVYQWMVENIGGIRSTAPAYKKVLMAPEPDPQLKSAAVVYRSIRGLITSDWQKKDGQLLFNVTIPANTTALVALPAKSESDITESGLAIAQAPGVEFLRLDGPKAILSIGSGSYAFAISGTP
ncbi:MAG: glycoside hydrolase family 78 protein [Verrucomicrobia bacterium]|nr:glycoside hydrolase family 78 protein [Verrucomicrobiota bacterium]